MDIMRFSLSGTVDNLEIYPDRDIDLADADILDGEGGTLSGAWSLNRRLRNAYAGDAFQIKRASDSTTTEIAFETDGSVDHNNIETFCSGTTCWVRFWYDQSGNGNDMSSDRFLFPDTIRPIIYENGLINTHMGRLVMRFETDNDTQMVGSLTGASTTAGFYAVGRIEIGTDGNARLIQCTEATTSFSPMILTTDALTNPGTLYQVGGVRTAVSLGGFHTFWIYGDGGDFLVDIDMDLESLFTNEDDWDDPLALDTIILGENNQINSAADGLLAEVVVYNGTMPTDYTNIRDNMVDYYKIT